MLGFLKEHRDHYRRSDGTETGELRNFVDSVRPLQELYGDTLAREFSPKDLKAVRQAMINAGLARRTINQRIGRIVHVFKWAVSDELVPPAQWGSMRSGGHARPMGPVAGSATVPGPPQHLDRRPAFHGIKVRATASANTHTIDKQERRWAAEVSWKETAHWTGPATGVNAVFAIEEGADLPSPKDIAIYPPLPHAVTVRGRTIIYAFQGGLKKDDSIRFTLPRVAIRDETKLPWPYSIETGKASMRGGFASVHVFSDQGRGQMLPFAVNRE